MILGTYDVEIWNTRPILLDLQVLEIIEVLCGGEKSPNYTNINRIFVECPLDE
jgi:hypothetical protein